MATLAITDAECDEVRLQIGNKLTATDLSNEQIRAGTVLGAASDYVFEQVREGLDLSKLTDDERLIAERFRDETDDDIANFTSQILKPPQVQQMRRAVIFRTSGMAVQIVESLLAESAGGINQRIQARAWEVLQASLFQRGDEEIQRLRATFPDDAFPSESQRAAARYNLFAVN